MTDFMRYIASGGTVEAPSEAELDSLLKRCEWFSTARRVRALVRGERDERLELAAPWRGESALDRPAVDAGALTFLTSEDLIDRFLREENLRIVAEEGEPETEVRTEAEFTDEEDLVSEELAEIYLAQGLRSKAIDTYRKLSLLNPEKSVYFAELIGKIETNN